MKTIKSLLRLNLHKELFKYKLFGSFFLIVNDKVLDLYCSRLNITKVQKYMQYYDSVTYVVRTKGSVETNGKIKKDISISNKYYINFSKDELPSLECNNISYTVDNTPLKQFSNVYLFFDGFGKSVDNGYYLYNYYSQYHPEIKSYYIIEKMTSYFQEINNDSSNILVFDSKEFRVKYKEATKIFSSVVDYKIENYRGLRFKNNVNTKEFIFLSHGAFLGPLPLFNRYRINYFIASDKHTQINIAKSTNLSKDLILLTGLPRTDYRYQLEKKTIVFAPTWNRFSFEDQNLDHFFCDRLFNFLEENDLYLHFIPHHLLKFQSPKYNERVKIIKVADYSLEIAKAKLFITDYSSIFMDFWWENIPVYFLQENKLHYDYKFDYSKIGYVFSDVNSLLENIEKKIEIINNTDFTTSLERNNCSSIFYQLEEKNAYN